MAWKLIHQKAKVVVFDKGNGVNDCKLYLNSEQVDILVGRVFCKNEKNRVILRCADATRCYGGLLLSIN